MLEKIHPCLTDGRASRGPGRAAAQIPGVSGNSDALVFGPRWSLLFLGEVLERSPSVLSCPSLCFSRCQERQTGQAAEGQEFWGHLPT